MLDELVSEGIAKVIDHRWPGIESFHPARNPAIEKEIKDLDQYMLAYGSMLGKQAERALEPLHVPGRDSLPNPGSAA